MHENPKPPKRRWLRFSIKAALLATLVIGAFLAGWKACEVEYREDAESWREQEEFLDEWNGGELFIRPATKT